MDQKRTGTFPWLDELLACPACAKSLVRDDRSYHCAACERYYPIRFGIADFRLAPDPYISIDDEVKKIERFSSPHRSFAESVKKYYELTPESPSELHRHYLAAMDASVSRGAGILRKVRGRHPDLGRENLLDLGCGTCGMSIAAAREYTRVVGVDVALRWLVMASLRLEEEGIALPLVCANAESLPFKENVFDVVVSDAVLEHARDSTRMRDETIRVLNHGGAFFFTTNNRFSVLPEPHVRILGFGLLPRRVMERAAKAVRRTPYRARLHSRRELRRIFDGKGSVLLPSFEAGELGPQNERARKLWDRLRAIPGIATILGPFVPQYFITGAKR
ncbi:MAG: methyltransferase domain-containing protein [Gemmatimonadaceae bacterium]